VNGEKLDLETPKMKVQDIFEELQRATKKLEFDLIMSGKPLPDAESGPIASSAGAKKAAGKK
jgi:hypothetical protein